MAGTENGVYAVSNFGAGVNLPEAYLRDLVTDEDTPKSFSLAVGTTPQATWQYVVTQPSAGTLTGTAPNLTYTPPANFNQTLNGKDWFS